ncbi:MAG TPA: hypothetical protein DCR39_02770 [Nitrospiraceae bacterium]|nr:hypothetical protein [Nitrospiraceae bacterium]
MISDDIFQYLTSALVVVSIFSIIANRIYPIIKWSQPYRLIFLIIPSLLALIPIAGISAARMLLSLNHSYSIGLTILLLVFIINKFFKVLLLSHRDSLYLSIFNIILGFILYTTSLGFISYDIYYAGYNFWPLFFIISVLIIILVLGGSRLQWVFIAYILGWNMKFIPSPNFFDYLIDPLLFFISTGVVASYMIKFARNTGITGGNRL